MDAIYDQTIKPELAGLAGRRRWAVIFFYTAVSVALVACALEILSWPRVRNFRLMVGIVGMTALFVPLLGLLPVARVSRTMKAEVLVALCTPLGLVYAPKGGVAPDVKRFVDLHLLPKRSRSSKPSFFDFVSGRRGSCDFAFCQAFLIERGFFTGQVSVVRGLLLQITRPRTGLGTTVVLPKDDWPNQQLAGVAMVRFEEPDFNSRFVVLSSDPEKARAVLPDPFLRRLIDFQGRFAQRHLCCAFADGRFLLMIEQQASRFGTGKVFPDLVHRSRVEHIARDLQEVLGFVDQFAEA